MAYAGIEPEAVGVHGPGGTPDVLRGLAEAVAGFEPVSLLDLGAAALMNRVDTKFVFPVARVPELLDALRETYRALEVGGRRLGHYRTVYLDTPDLHSYLAQHNGRAPRFKVRVRTYLDSGEQYLEIKRKGNDARTAKSRVRLDPERRWAEQPAADLCLPVRLGSATHVRDLQQSAAVEFTRLTLVDLAAQERVTLDLALIGRRGDLSCSFPGLAIAEAKQDRRQRSRFLEAMRQLHVRPGALSKYCMTIATLEPRVRSNLFKHPLRRIGQIGGPSLSDTSGSRAESSRTGDHHILHART
jgi:hypothetical protein